MSIIVELVALAALKPIDAALNVVLKPFSSGSGPTIGGCTCGARSGSNYGGRYRDCSSSCERKAPPLSTIDRHSRLD